MIRRLEVRYRDEARTDLDEIFWHIALHGNGPRAALDFVRRLDERCQRIADAPRSGRPRDDLAAGLRTLAFERSALICYRIADDGIWVTNIFGRGRDFDAVLRDAPQEQDEA